MPKIYSKDYQRGALSTMQLLKVFASDPKTLTLAAIEQEIKEIEAWQIKQDVEPEKKDDGTAAIKAKTESISELNRQTQISISLVKNLTEALSKLPIQQGQQITGTLETTVYSPDKGIRIGGIHGTGN